MTLSLLSNFCFGILTTSPVHDSYENNINELLSTVNIWLTETIVGNSLVKSVRK